MPKNSDLSENSETSATVALVINESGPIGSCLVDSLLSLGCQVFYFDNSRQVQIEHLKDRRNFFLLKKFQEIEKISVPNYTFYLSDKVNKNLPAIVRFVKEKKSKFLFATRENWETVKKLSVELAGLELDSRICLFEEIYGPRICQGIVWDSFFALMEGIKIKLMAEKFFPVSLVFYSDFIHGLVRAMLTPETSGAVFNFQGQLVSAITLLDNWQKLTGKSYDFQLTEGRPLTSPRNEEKKENPSNPAIMWEPEIVLEEGLKETWEWWKKSGNLSNKRKSFQRGKINFPKPRICLPKKLIIGAAIFCLLIFTCFVVPATIFLNNLSIAGKSLLIAKENLEKNDWEGCQRQINIVQKRLVFNRRFFEIFGPFYEVFNFGEWLSDLETILIVEEKSVVSLENYSELEEIFLSSLVSFWQGEKADITAKVPRMSYLTENLYSESSQIWGIIESRSFNSRLWKILPIETEFKKLKESLPGLRSEVSRIRLLLPYLTEILGEKGKRNYLILFQDNLELRPSGGLLKSFALVTVEEGKLTDFSIQTVKSADEKLRGEIEPPQPIKDYYGERKWYLKDANWWPDFPQTAQKIQWFLEKEIDKDFDGVFAVNLNFFKKLIDFSGALTLPKTQEVIDSANFFERAVYFPKDPSGLELDDDFTAEIAKEYLVKIKQFKQGEMADFVKAFWLSLKDKDWQLTFKDAKLAELVGVFSWDGSIQENLVCPKISERCLADYFTVNEANLGANRANYFIRRLLTKTVKIGESGDFEITDHLSYQNLSLGDSWPAGRYKNYLRVYLPAGSSLERIIVNDPTEPEYWTEIPLEKIDFNQEGGKNILGFLVEIPARSQRIVEIKYKLQKLILDKSFFSYTLLWQKQSGIEETPISLTFELPEGTRPLKILPKGVYQNGKVVINDNLDQDKIIRIDFTR